MSETLKPCPFCGGQGVMGTGYSNGIYTATIECDKCYVRTPDMMGRHLKLVTQEAIDAWNRRENGTEK